jgi:hypothetical protein
MARKLVFRRIVAAIGIAAVAIMAVGPTAGAAAGKKTKIDTYKDWPGTPNIQPWGNPDTATYGQTITIPKGNKHIKSFSFYMSALAASGTIRFTGDVYGWDGSKATTEVFESKVKSIDLTVGDPTFHTVTIKTKGAKVKPGQQYVLFLSVSKTYEETDPGVTSAWADLGFDDLAGGNLVFLNNGGDESLWTTQAWAPIPTDDMAFQATLK